MAFLLDILLQDPWGVLHPVNLVAGASRRLARFLRGPQPLFGGIALTISVVGGTYGITRLALAALSGNPWLRWGLELFLLQSALSVRGLGRAAGEVRGDLERNDLSRARRSLRQLVGRDTENLTTEGIVRAALESVAENTVDGVISPLFYALLGGAPLAMAFKAASTLDSLFGYRTPALRRFGWASARLDDLLNFVPARLAVPLIALAALPLGLSGSGALRTARRDGRRHPSPNSGYPESAFAGALGVRLGGQLSYGGRREERPELGEPLRGLEPARLREAVSLLYLTSSLALLTGILIRFWVVGS